MKSLQRTGLVLGVLALALVPTMASASAFSIEDIGTTIGLGTADLKDTVVNIIQWVLGILALVAVVMIIIGGFQWMTAAGSEERIEKAKKIISSAVIGLIIVLLAWAIVIFVAGTTANVTV
ncbi:MAG: pilin [Patescibacteria group bacterium]|jgi:type IV secretory pathway VirB2 component (pilin)